MKEIAVEIIKEELTKKGIKVIKIILFGSRVKGYYKADSDWDFLIIVKEDLSRDEKWDAILHIKRRLAKLKISNDIIINSEKEFKERLKDVGYITYYALKEGVEV
jgi:predicted nucleotidyltransferase